MLAVSPLTTINTSKNERENHMETTFDVDDTSDFLDFAAAGNLLDSIDFDDDIFIGITDGDVLPDLEMDPEILADFSAVAGGAGDDPPPPSLHYSTSGSVQAEETAQTGSVTETAATPTSTVNSSGNKSPGKSEKGKKSTTTTTANSKNPPGKRKVKVDWTPELHRRFVQAVEQLGVDKAVPSRILEIMGIDCLTRHNIASHLQKYRSHRKHLLAREAEAANWGQRRQPSGGATTTGGKRDINPWIAPTMGFPPPVNPMPPFRPLHVWGHPPVDQSLMHIWPKHQTAAPPAPQAWPQPQPPDPSFWIPHHHHVPTPGTPCFPPYIAPTRFPPPPVPGIPPPMMKVESGMGFPTVTPGQALPRPPSDLHPSKETVDAAIEDVLSKPWLPLPLGLKPPSVDSVMVELHRQGVSKVPPTCG